MIRRIEQTVDFIKLKRRIKGIIGEQVETMYGDADKRLRERLNKGVDYKGSRLPSLKNSTLNIRKLRGKSNVTPLIDTGRLKNSIKLERANNKIGVSFLKYGMHQAEGFTTNNHFAVKKGSKVVGFRDYSGGIRIQGREWINPLNPAEGLAVNKKLAQRLIAKNIRKHLKGKVVHKF